MISCGILYLSSTQKEIDRQVEWPNIGKRHQPDVELLDEASAATLVNTGPTGRRWVGGLWSPALGAGILTHLYECIERYNRNTVNPD